MKNLARATTLALVLTAATAVAGPIYDPFLERFQVGTYADPATIPLREGLPAELDEPVIVDEVWLVAATRLLAAEAPPGSFLGELLAALPDGGDRWRELARAAVADLADRGAAATAEPEFLRHERRVAAYFAALAVDDRIGAALMAELIAAPEDGDSPPAREVFVWRLRQRGLREPREAEPVVWPEVVDLGPFDSGNAWSLWVARRRAANLPVLALPDPSQEWLRFLGGLRRSWLQPEDIYSSPLPADWQAGLGAVLLGRSPLTDHFRRFATPPHHLALQGHWVRGRRASHSGQAAYYEELAARDDLRPAWRLDVWRRASELRLLKGEWDAGLTDLERALDLARIGRGTRALRLRLRQWVEQAMVLALAQGRDGAARRLHHHGLRGFADKEKAAFVAETRHWNRRLGIIGGPTPELDGDILGQARLRVEQGRAPGVEPTTDGHRHRLLAAAERSPWRLWARWGMSLVDSNTVSGANRRRAGAYVRALNAVVEAGDFRRAAVAAFTSELPGETWLGQALDRDIAVFTSGGTPPQPSLVPALVTANKGSHITLHALLGFALAGGDMRGSLAAAFLLPAGDLTRDEKRTFLYPLPGPGPIREAVLAADNDPALLLAVARNESLFEPAIRSRAGALGWMQIMPFHYEENGAVFGPGNWSNPAVSIARGDALLSEARRRYGGDPYRCLAAYNAGPEAADRWDRQLGGDAARDIYLAWIGYPETRAYVEKVLIDREIYTAIIGGP